ncbi:MAG: hypothetical protein Q9182_003201 [Xanthomendoza sp. 2 TL-2023]
MTPMLEAAIAEDEEARVEAKIQVSGSHIHFYTRHPEDTTNPLTFLDGSSGAGTGDTGVYANWKAGPRSARASTAGSCTLMDVDEEEFKSSPPIPIALPKQHSWALVVVDGASYVLMLK